MTQNDLKPRFVRGQVWENPDGEIMMVTCVSGKLNDNGFIVAYVSQDGETGTFDNSDTDIINNITLVSTRAALQEGPRETDLDPDWQGVKNDVTGEPDPPKEKD